MDEIEAEKNVHKRPRGSAPGHSQKIEARG